jgi:sulfopyruvate decarboxylase TPP-binding subunit
MYYSSKATTFHRRPRQCVEAVHRELHPLPAEQHVPATWEAETLGIRAGAYLAGRR